jgi:hypothetical protein
VIMPAMIFRNVDLPHPDLPIIDIISPGFTWSDMSRRISWFE